MKKFLILILIFLTACTSNAANPSDPSTAVTSDPGIGPAYLSLESTSEQIQRAMLDSAARWQSLRLDGTIGFFEPGGLVMQATREQVWIDQTAFRFRVLVGIADGTIGTLKASDGVNIIEVNLKTGETLNSTYPDSAR